MEHSRGKPPPPALRVPTPSSSSPWMTNLPYNSLSEEGSYGSFALYAPSPVPSPMHLSASSYPGKDPSGSPFPSRNGQLYSESRGLPRHLTRSISSSEGLRRHRRPLSELLSTPEGPPSPLPAFHRRSSLSNLMAGSLDFDRPPRMDEDMHLLNSHMRHPSASFAVPPFAHASRGVPHYNTGTSHHGFLTRASSDRFDLDPMIWSSFDQREYQNRIDPLLATPPPTYYSTGLSRRNGESTMVSDYEIGGGTNGVINEHSHKKIQYLRSRSHNKSQGMNAPLSPLSPVPKTSYSSGKSKNSPYNVTVRTRTTMRDMLATDGELTTKPLHHPQHAPLKDHHYDKNGDSMKLPFDHYNALNVPASFDHRYGHEDVVDENHHFGLQDPALYADIPHGAGAKTQYSAFVKDCPASNEQHYKGSGLSNGHDHRKALKDLNAVQEAVPSAEVRLSSKNSTIGEAKPRFEMKWSAPMGMAGHSITADIKAPSNVVRKEMEASGSPLDSYNQEYNVMGSYAKAKQQSESRMKDCVLTKGRSILDHVTENIVRKLILLSCKYADQALPEAAISSAKFLFKRVLVVQIQALAPKLTEISADENQLADRYNWVTQGSSSLMRGNKQGQLPHQGLSLLHLQKVLYEKGTGTFDTLMKMRTNLYEWLITPSVGGESSGQFRIACAGGVPGCGAMALHLFFLLLTPFSQAQVDVLGADEQSKKIMEELSFRDIKCASLESACELVRRNPSMMRYYKLLMLVDCLGEAGKGEATRVGQQWKSIWDMLHENAAPGAVVVVYESVPCRWEDMAPSTSPWQFSSLPGLDSVRIGRKH